MDLVRTSFERYHQINSCFKLLCNGFIRNIKLKRSTIIAAEISQYITLYFISIKSFQIHQLIVSDDPFKDSYQCFSILAIKNLYNFESMMLTIQNVSTKKYVDIGIDLYNNTITVSDFKSKDLTKYMKKARSINNDFRTYVTQRYYLEKYYDRTDITVASLWLDKDGYIHVFIMNRRNGYVMKFDYTNTYELWEIQNKYKISFTINEIKSSNRIIENHNITQVCDIKNKYLCPIHYSHDVKYFYAVDMTQ